MKANITIALLFLAVAAAFGQAKGNSQEELMRYQRFFKKHHVPLDQYAFDSEAINTQLSKAVKHQRQQQTLFITGGTLFVAGAFLMLRSIRSPRNGVDPAGSLSNDISKDLSKGYRQMGAISLGASAPILLIGSNQAYKRDKAIEEAKRLLE